MASHAPQTILFVTNEGSVMSNGYSTRLAKGQFGIVDKGATPSALGMAVVNTFPATPKDRLFELKLGIAPLTPTRSQSNKAYSSMPFKLSEIVDIKVNAPKLGVSVDEFIIGYDGINYDTRLNLQPGDNEVIDITLAGEAIGMLGYPEAKVTVKLYLEAPNAIPGQMVSVNMEKIVQEGVERLKQVTLLGGVPITEYIDITPVNSSNPQTVTGTAYTFFKLKVQDAGNASALGLVQAQYPAHLVKREEFIGGVSEYVILAPSNTSLASFAQILSSQDSDCAGSPDCTDTVTNIAWTAGEVGTAVAKTFTLQLADDKCGEDKLEALQAAYPELAITAGQSQACQTVYTTTVLSNIVSEECSPILRDLFLAEAPAPYEFVSWEAAPVQYNGMSAMGIHLKGKVNIFAGSEEYRDELPFVYSSTRISIANAAPGLVSESFKMGSNGRFNVKLLSIATEPEAVGGQFYDLEERTRVYFENRQRLAGNNYGKLVLGQESHLKPTVQYVDYSIRIRTNRFAQSFSGEVVENIDYHILVDACKYQGVEALINQLATAAGLPTVQAYPASSNTTTTTASSSTTAPTLFGAYSTGTTDYICTYGGSSVAFSTLDGNNFCSTNGISWSPMFQLPSSFNINYNGQIRQFTNMGNNMASAASGCTSCY
jgi:hypothetical protein